MVNNFSVSDKIIEDSRELARSRGHLFLTLEHVLAVLLRDKEVQDVINIITSDIDEISQELYSVMDDHNVKNNNGDVIPTDAIARMMDQATITILCSDRENYIALDLLYSITKELPEYESFATFILEHHGVTEENLKAVLSNHDMYNFSYIQEDQIKKYSDLANLANSIKVQVIDGKTFEEIRKTLYDDGYDQTDDVVSELTVNLNERAATGKIDNLIGRETEVENLILSISRRTKNNVIMVGDPGVGKTSIAEGFAKMIVDGKVPENLKNAVVYSLEISNIVAGSAFRGQMEQKIIDLASELEYQAENKNILPILFIDEIHTMMGTGASQGSSMDIANILKPYLSRGSIRCIGGTTHEEYRKYFEKDRAMVRRFRKLIIEEPDVETAKKIIRGIKKYYENYHGVKYDKEAINAAVDLSARYITSRKLPDKAIDVIDIAGSRRKIAADNLVITKEMVEFEVGKLANISIHDIDEDNSHSLATLETDLKKSVFGQDDAVAELADSVIINKAGLRSHDKPQGCYLLTGPTGTGKTEICKQLASNLGIQLVRFDMSEYMEKHSVSKFIGSPPGYVGYDDGAAGSGLLANEIEKYPRCVLLIDEIEKAHPDVYNLFLQIMDNGKLTVSSGKEIDFTNVILIMTSNAGATELEKNSIGFGTSVTGNDDKIINQTFSPEFRNRLDGIIKFNHISNEHMVKIVDKFIADLNKLASDKKVKISMSKAAKLYLANKGYDPKNGARPLARLIQSEVSNPIGKMIVLGDLSNGGKVKVDCVDDQLTFAIN